MPIHIHRAYDTPIPEGHHVLVDRLWPRGIRKDDLPIDEWAKHLAPSTELRKWFNHDPAKWTEFQSRYQAELASESAELDRLRKISQSTNLILIYSARDPDHNQAVVLQEALEHLEA